jgi:hypothetical protein
VRDVVGRVPLMGEIMLKDASAMLAHISCHGVSSQQFLDLGHEFRNPEGLGYNIVL